MNKKILISVTLIVAVVVIGISIYTVIQKSDEILSNSNVESIKNTDSHDTHHASGDTFDLPVIEIMRRITEYAAWTTSISGAWYQNMTSASARRAETS